MGQPSNHPKSVVLDHCWVCGTRFDSGQALREDHHMVPRAYGGVDGPTVTLCETDHGRVHKIATALRVNKPYHDLTKGADADAKKKLLYLANIVYNSELAMRNDPNKSASVVMSLNAQQKHMIEKLQNIYPHARSRSDILALALLSLYSRHFV